MAEELTPQTDDWSKYEVKPEKAQTATDDWSQYEVKKKSLPQGSKNTLNSLPNGGNLDPVSLQNTLNATAPLASVTDKQLRTDIQVKDDAIRQQKLQQQEQLSNNLKKIRNQLPEESQKFWDKAVKLTADRVPDRLTTPTKDEEEHQWIMDELDKTWQGKLVKAVGYLGSKASKGTLQIAKGVAHQAELSQNPLRFATGQDGATDKFFKKADDFANFGLTKSDLSHIEQGDNMGSHAMATGGTMAEMAPTIALGSAASAPEALFWLQGIGMGKDLTEDLKKQGKDLNPLAKEALIQGSGVVNMILSRFGDMYGKLPSIARGKIASGIAAEALQKVAGKELTSDVFKTELVSLSKTFAQKLETAPLEILNKYNHTATTFAGLNTANYIMHKGVDAINDKPVFNESLGNLAENLYKSITQEAPLFTIAGSVPEITKLTPYSGYKNDVVESIVRDPSKENVDAIKSQIANHGSEQGWSQEEMAGSLQHIEQIGAATRKLPNTITPDKKSDAVGLIIDRDGLTKKLKQIQEGKQELDPAIADVPTAQEQYLTDKIEQANDKIRSIVTGKKVTYSKDETNPEKPKFFKTIGGKQGNIEQSRYDLENTERQLKTTINEQPVQPENDKVNTELLPEQQKETSANVPDETVKPVVDEQSRPTADNAGTVESIAEPIQQPEAKQQSLEKNKETVLTGDKGVQGNPIDQTEIKPDKVIALERPDVKPSISPVGENVKATTLRNADVEKKRAEYGFDKPVERKGTTDAEFDAKADAEIKSGYDAHALMEKVLLDKHPITGVESVILAKFQGIKESELLNINDKIEKATDSSDISFAQMTMDRDRILDDLQRAYNASEVSGTVASDALRARKVRVAQDASLAGFLIRERQQVNKGDKLSQEQIKKVSDEYKDIQRKNDAYQKKIAELEAQLKSESAGKSFERIKAEVALENRRTKREIKISEIDKDITDVFASLKKIAREKRSMLSANPIPVEYIPEIAKLVKLYAQKGITSIEGIVDNIYNGLKDDIDGLTKEHVLETIGNLPDATKKDPLKAIKSRLKSSIRKVEEKTANNDFTPTKRNKIVLDKEAQQLRDELEKARYEYELRLARDAYAKRTKYEKVKDAISEVFNMPMALLSSMDFSAPLRQGAVPTASHPIIASKAFVYMFRAAFSNKAFDRWFYDLREADDYHVMKDAKLYIADPHKPQLAAKEEQFMSNLAEKIPVLGRLVKGSEQAYVGYLNKLRVDLFRHFSELYTSNGKTPANNPELYKGLANYINNATGRGNFINESIAQSLNGVLFSPRLVASRFNLLMNPRFYAKLPKEVRIQAATDMVKFISVGIAVLALAKVNGVQVEIDPRSSDFGKGKIGDTRFDIFAGFTQYVRLVAGVITGQTKSTSTGDISDSSKRAFGAKSRLDKIIDFFRSKAAPVPGFILNTLDGKDAIGKDFVPSEELYKLFVPLVANDIVEAVKRGGVSAGLSVGIPSTFGVSVQTYSDLKPVKEVEAKPEISLESGVKYKLTDEQLAERKKYNDEFLAKNGERLKNVYTQRAMNDPELKMEIATKVKKYKQMQQSNDYIEAHKKESINSFIMKRLGTAANKYSKLQMLKKYRTGIGKYSLEKSDE